MTQLDAVEKRLIEGDEHGKLNEDGQTASHGVDAVGLVELHHFAAERFLVVLVLLLQLLHHGLELLHLLHGLEALAGKRPEHDLDEDGQQDDGETPVAEEAFKEGEKLEQRHRKEGEDAHVDGGLEGVGRGVEQVAALGTEPPGGLEFGGLTGGQVDVLQFHGGAPYAAFGDAALEHGVLSHFGQNGGKEVVAHETGPVDVAGAHDAFLGEVFLVGVALERALEIPGHAHGVVVALAAEVRGAEAVGHAGGGSAGGGGEGHLFIHEIGVGMEGDDAADADAVHLAGEGQRGFAVFEVDVGAVEAPLAHVPRRLTVDEQPHGGHRGGGGGNHVEQRGAGGDGGVVVLQLERLEHAAAGVKHGFVERRVHMHFAAFGRHELGHGHHGSGRRGSLSFGLGLFFGGRGLGLFGNPAHVFGKGLPADEKDNADDDGDDEATVIHDVPESLRRAQRDDRLRGGAQDRSHPDCRDGSAGCA